MDFTSMSRILKSALEIGYSVFQKVKNPVTTFLKVAYGTRQGPVARAPLALLETDDLAAWTLRRPSAKQCSDRVTTPG